MQNVKEWYDWWKEKVLKVDVFEEKNFLTQTIKDINKGILDDYFELIKEDTNYLPEDISVKERLYHLVYELNEPANKCKYCGGKVKLISFYQGYQKYCSQKCSFKDQDYWDKVQNTNMERYGSKYAAQNEEVSKKLSESLKETFKDKEKKEEILSKRKKTYQEKTGYQHQMYNPEVVDRFNRTMLENYGVEKPLQNKDILKKTQLTNLDKYGNKCTLLNEDVMKKSRDTTFERYGEDHWTKTKDGKEYLRQAGLERHKDRINEILESKNLVFNDYIDYQCTTYPHIWKCTICNNSFKRPFSNIRDGFLCPTCYPEFTLSRPQEEITKYLQSLDLYIERNDRRIIYPKELDIVIPSHNLAIEYNGLYWHSESIQPDKNYHLTKTELCQEKGIRLLHIFEDEWEFKQLLIKEKLKNILGMNNDKQRIHARQCTIREIDPKSKNLFLDNFHLQGRDSSRVKLGAFYNNELISVMTFSNRNISKGSKHEEGVFELNRFAVNYNYHIPGIASKLLTYFKRNYNWKKIISYADRRFSEGNLYFKLGFNHIHNTQVNYWYIRDSRRIHRFKLRKRSDEPKEIAEWVLRHWQGYDRIWDCGHMKFEMINE